MRISKVKKTEFGLFVDAVTIHDKFEQRSNIGYDRKDMTSFDLVRQFGYTNLKQVFDNGMAIIFLEKLKRLVPITERTIKELSEEDEKEEVSC